VSLATKPSDTGTKALKRLEVSGLIGIKAGLAIRSESLALVGKPTPRLILDNLSASYWCFIILAIA